MSALMTTRPHLLAITSELPWPLNSGGHLRTYHLLHALGRAYDVGLVYPLNRDPGDESDLPENVGFRRMPYPVRSRSVVGEACRIGLAQMYRNPYSMYYRHYRRGLSRWWGDLIQTQQPDIVWLDHIDSLLYVPKAKPPNTRVVIDLHNIYSLILGRLAQESGGLLRRGALGVEAARMARVESYLCNRVDAVVAVSEEEAAYYRALGAKQVHVAPNGVDCAAVAMTERRRSTEAPEILFVGAMNWQPNVSAAIALATEIFPKIRQCYPAAQLKLVGKDPMPQVRQLAELPGVTVTGTVPSIIPYLNDASVFAVPLDSGGGTRLKILEAFAAGVPVVSTPVGAEGISAVDRIHLRLASRQEMASVIVELLQNGRGNELAKQARSLVEQHYDWRSIGRQTSAFLKTVQRGLS